MLRFVKSLFGGFYLAAAVLAASSAAAADKSNTLYMDLASGRVTIQLLPDIAPKHVARIKKLVSEKFYDGIVFHRVIDGFMAQTGDPSGTGRGGSDYPDLPAEFTDTPFKRGTIGAARTNNPDSANSQFFFCFTDGSCPHLRGQYTVWGQVTEGMEHIDSIKRGAPGSGIVNNPDKIVKMTLAGASQ